MTFPRQANPHLAVDKTLCISIRERDDRREILMEETRGHRHSSSEQEPVAWTDAEELRDLKRDGYAAMLSLSRKDCEHADPRRQILLFTHPAPSIPAAPVAVPDEWSLNDAINSIEEMGTVSEAGAAQQAWNACRAAMHNGGGQ